jgi:hypothetical protein
LGFTVSPATISHVARCPEVDPAMCAAGTPIPDHMHHVGVTMANVTLAGSFGLGRGLAIEARVPVDVKRLRVRYTTLHDEPYDPPYRNIHHRNETLSGPGDPRLGLRWDRGLGARWQIGFALGTTIPLGDTVEDPNPLAKESLPHQHMQIGSGTFDPVVEATAAWRPGDRLGAYARLDARLPLYESGKGYRAGTAVDVAAGPGLRLGHHHFGFVMLGLSHAGEETWDGVTNESSGRSALRLIAGSHVALGHRLQLGAVVQGELWSRAVGGEFDQPIIATVTVSYTSPTKGSTPP